MSDDSGGAEGEWDSVSGTAGGKWSRTLASVVSDPLYQADEEGRLTAVNDALVELTGRGREELLGEHVSVLFDRPDVGRSELARRRMDVESGDVETVTVAVRTADGNAVPCQLRVGPADPDGRKVVCQLRVEGGHSSSGDDARSVEDWPDDGSRDGGPNRALERQRDELRAELDDVFERVTDAFHALDEEFRFTYLNEQAEELLGRSEAELLGQNVWDEFPEAQERYRERYERAMETQEPIRFEEYSETVDGWLEVRVYPSESGLSVYFRDITDRRQREAELRNERDRAQTILELAGSIMVIIDPDGTVSYVNQRGCEVLGYDKEELEGEDWFETCIPTRMRGEVREDFDSIMAGELESLESYENPIVTADGDERVVTWNNTVLRDEHGTPTGTLSAGTDVTEQKRRAEHLDQYSEFLNQFYRVSTRSDRTFDQKVERLLSAGCDHLDFDIGVLSEIDGTDYHVRQVSDATGSIDVGDTYPLENTYCELTIQHAQPLGFESATDADLGTHPCYQEFGLRSYLAMAVHVGGELYGTLSFSSPTPRGREITELDRTLLTLLAQWVGYELERRARQRELEQYEQVLETIDEGVYVLDADGRYEFVNEAYVEMTGYDRTELLGSAARSVIPTETADRVEDAYRELSPDDQHTMVVEETVKRADGETFPAEATVSLMDLGGGEVGRVGVVRDITERKEFEDTLRALHSTTRELFGAESVDSVADIVVETTTETLDISGVAVFAYDEDSDELVPTAQSAEAGFMRGGDLPTVPADDGSLTGHAFVSGELTQFDDIRDAPQLQAGAETTEMRAGIVAPLGDRGVIVVGSREVGAFDERTTHLVDLLASNTEAALDRIDRERTLAESQRRYRTLVENFPNGAVTLFDEQLRFLVAGGEGLGQWGMSSEELTGNRLQSALPTVLVEQVEPHYRAAIRGEANTFEIEYQDSIRRFQAVPVRDDGGEIVAGMATSYDITDQRERERELARFRQAVEASGHVIYMTDAEGTITYVNRAFEETTGYAAAEAIGETPSILQSGKHDAEYYEDLWETVLAGEVWEEEIIDRRKSGELYYAEQTIAPVTNDDGEIDRMIAVQTDVTERKERERELEQYEKVTETVRDGICVLNADSEFVMVNDTFVAMTGYDRAELLGTHASLVRPASLNERFEAIQESLADGSDLETVEMEIENVDGNTRIIDARYGLFPREDGTTGRVGVWRDVTEQRERERQLARFERAVEASGHAIYMTDADGMITYVNQAFEETTGYTAAEAIGESPSILQSGKHDAEYYETLWETVLAGEVWEEEIIDRRKSGELYYAEQTIAPVTNDDGEIDRMIAVQTDVTERKEREEELQTRVEQQKGVTRLGQHALGTDDLDSLFDEAVEMVADTLGNEYAKVLDAELEKDQFVLRAGVGWRDGLVGEATVEDDLGSQAGYTLNSAEPVVVSDLDAETRFTGPELLTSHDVSSGISVVIGTPENPWGVLGTHETDARSFSEHDVNFVQSVANILTTAIERVEHEGEIRRQRERLAALNQVNGIVRDIIRALLQQSTREEVEQLVCERLAESDSYSFAWIGEIAGETDDVSVRTDAGVEGYLDDVTITVDDSETGQGATGRAFRTGEMQVTRDVLTEPEYETWRDNFQQYGFRSSAAIPIVHESTIYGTLNVYADRTDAFTGEERAVFEQLGDVMGHAINAIERKRLLMSDEVVEIDIRIRDVFEALGVAEQETGSIRFTRTVPVGDDSYVVYGTATDQGIETMTTLIDHLDHWTEFTEIDDGGDHRFELHMIEPPATSIVAAQGGRIQTASIEDGNYAMTVELPPEAPIRDVIDELRDVYDGAELLAQRKTAKDASTTRQLKADLSETLTDRQLAALEAAYFAGFFEWPRASNGEDVADALDVSPPTFHQHLRGAERRLLETLLEDSGTGG